MRGRLRPRQEASSRSPSAASSGSSPTTSATTAGRGLPEIAGRRPARRSPSSAAGPAGPDRRRRPRRDGPRGHRLRGAARAGRRAHLRHPRVPPAQEHRRPRGRRRCAGWASISSPNVVIGKTMTIDELIEEGYDAVFIGTGAGLPKFLDVPGENLSGVYSANEFLTRVNLMQAYDFPELRHPDRARQGTSPSSAAATWRWTRSARPCASAPRTPTSSTAAPSDEMPARAEETHHAEAGGHRSSTFLTNPVRFLGDDDGWVRQMVLPADGARRARRLRAGAARCRSTTRSSTLDVDTVVVAIGTAANPLVTSTTPGLADEPPGLHRRRRGDRRRRPGRASSPAATSSPARRRSSSPWVRGASRHRPSTSTSCPSTAEARHRPARPHPGMPAAGLHRRAQVRWAPAPGAGCSSWTTRPPQEERWIRSTGSPSSDD